MPSTSYRAHPDLLVYYGTGQLDALARSRRVVLQADHYSPADLGQLAAGGTSALAYLSIGEDTGPEAPWQLPEKNSVWGGRYVDPAHPGWRAHLVAQAESALADGFTGLMLDTIETPPVLRGGQAAVVRIVEDLRALMGDGYLLANRGYALLADLAPLVDGFLFEAFSTTWEDGYRSLRGRELLDNATRLSSMRATGRELFALDYADRPELADFAVARGANLGLPVQVTDRYITGLPGRSDSHAHNGGTDTATSTAGLSGRIA